MPPYDHAYVEHFFRLKPIRGGWKSVRVRAAQSPHRCGDHERAVCCARARQPRPHSTHSDDEWHCYPLARGCLPILCAPFGTEAYCTAEVMVLLICRNQLIIAATVALCICLAPYPLIWSGPIHPSWTNFSIPSLPALYASKRVTQNTAMHLVTTECFNESATI